MTQEQLAQILQMSDKFVSKWERGICLPPMEKLKSLCHILDISNEIMIKKLMNVQRKRLDAILLQD